MTDYSPTVWQPGSAGGTPVNAANLNHLETGIQTAHAELAAHLAANPIDHPAGSVTDAKIGNRTANPALVPSSNGPTALTTWLSWITNRVKTLVGGSNWYDAPLTTLAAIAAHIADSANPHGVTAATLGAWGPDNDGAGSGLDADLIGGVAHAAVGRIASGSYTGNGVGRTITLGWQPSWVVIRRAVVENLMIGFTTSGLGLRLDQGGSSPPYLDNPNGMTILSTGFRLSAAVNAEFNEGGISYHWTAFGVLP